MKWSSLAIVTLKQIDFQSYEEKVYNEESDMIFTTEKNSYNIIKV